MPIRYLAMLCPGPPSPNSPEVNGWPTANVALVISGLAALVAIVAVTFTARTFYRGGARVKVNLRQRRWLFNDFDGTPHLAEVVMVDIRNSGLASIQISEISWETDNGEEFSVTPDVSLEDTPRVLSGLSADLTTYRVDRLSSGAHVEEQSKKIRAVVLLAGTEKEKSGWIKLGG